MPSMSWLRKFILSLQIKLAVTHAKFPLTEGKSGILSKHITFTFYKYTELNPDSHKVVTEQIVLDCISPDSWIFLSRLWDWIFQTRSRVYVSLLYQPTHLTHWFQMFAQMLQDSIICSFSHLPSSHTAKTTGKTSWREETSLKKQIYLPVKLTQYVVKFQKYEFKNTDTYPYLFRISQRW